MLERMDIEQRGLATAGSSCAVHACARRNRLVAFIAVVLLAAAVMFAMPSLAFASPEDASQQASEAQEILQSQRERSTSANKAPDESPTPPGYTALDAYTSTSELKATEVVLVSGAGDSSYTAGDQKDSIGDKDSDDGSDLASDSDETAGQTENEKADDSIANGNTTSDDSNGQKTDNHSTGVSTGASSNVTDEIATGGDSNQSAHPTGDSKADDVIAAPCDGESADQNVSANSGKTEEVQQQSSSNIQTSAVVTNDITTQGTATKYTGTTPLSAYTTNPENKTSYAHVYLYFDMWNTANGTPSATGIKPTSADPLTDVVNPSNYAGDKIYGAVNNTSGRMTWTTVLTDQMVGKVGTYLELWLPTSVLSSVFPQLRRYGYNLNQWDVGCIRTNVNTGKVAYAVKRATIAATAPMSGILTVEKSGNFETVYYLYPVWADAPRNTVFQDIKLAQTPERNDVWGGVVKVPDALTQANLTDNQIPTNRGFKREDFQGWFFYHNDNFGVLQEIPGSGGVYESTDPSAKVDNAMTWAELFTKSYMAGTQGDTIDRKLWELSRGDIKVLSAWKKEEAKDWKVTFDIDPVDAAANRGTLTNKNGLDPTISISKSASDRKITQANYETAMGKIEMIEDTDGDGYQRVATSWKWRNSDGSQSGTFATLQALYDYVVNFDIIISPVWERITGYSVTFNPNAAGASATPSSWGGTSTSYYDSSVAFPTTSYAGHTFQGWQYETAEGAMVSIGDKNTTSMKYSDIIEAISSITDKETTKSLTLKAKWDESSYSVIFKSNKGHSDFNIVNGATQVGTASPKWTQTFTLAAPAANTGYKFVEWRLANGTPIAGMTYADAVNNVASTMTLDVYAYFEEEVRTIIFKVDSNGHATLAEGSQSGQTTITRYVGAITGNLYTGVNGTKTNTTLGNVTPTFSTGYKYSAWAPSVSGNFNDTTGTLAPKSGTTYTNGTYTLSAAAEMYHYRVDYYLMDTDGTTYKKHTDYGNVSLPSGTDTGSTAAYDSTVYVDGLVATPPTGSKKVSYATLTGFTFDSNKTRVENNGTGSLVMAPSTSQATTPNVLKLYYSRNKFTITSQWSTVKPGSGIDSTPAFTVGGTSKTSPATNVYYGQSIVFNAPAAQPGYTFKGWTTNVSGTGSTSNATSPLTFNMPNSAVTVTGTWETLKYQVVFVNNDSVTSTWGSLGDGTGFTSGNNYTALLENGAQVYPNAASGNPTYKAPSATANSGYYFMGWEYTNAAGAKARWAATDVNPLTISPTNFTVASTGASSGNAGKIEFKALWGRIFVVNYTPGDQGTFAGIQSTNIQSNDALPLNNFSYEKLCQANNRPNNGLDTTTTNPRNAGKPTGKNGYVFTGWVWTMTDDHGTVTYHTTVPGGTQYGGKTYNFTNITESEPKVACSMEFIAQWAPTTQNIVFQDENGAVITNWKSAPSYSTAQTGKTFNLPNSTNYERPGYSFKWKNVATGVELAAGAQQTATAGTLRAGGTNTNQNDYEIVYKLVLTQGTADITYTISTKSPTGAGTLTKTSESLSLATGVATGSVAKANPHFVFDGWFTDNTCTTQITSANAATYFVTLGDDVDGGAGSKITPIKNGSGVYVDGSQFFAKFSAIMYSIYFTADDTDHTGAAARGTISGTSPVSKKYGDSLSGLVTVTAKPGYTHSGWKYYADNAWHTVNTSFSGGTPNRSGTVWGTVELVATYTENNNYSITFTDPGNTSSVINGVTKSNVSWSTPISGLGLAAGYDQRAGYTFKGFALNTDTGTVKPVSTTYAEFAALKNSANPGSVTSITLQPIWEAKNNFTVNYDLNYTGSSNPAPKTSVSWTQNNLLPTQPTREGYVFDGWFVENLSNPSATFQAANGDAYSKLAGGVENPPSITLTAHWTLKKYQITYKDGNTQYTHAGATGDSTPVLNWTSTVPLPTITKTGQTFLGWTDEDGDIVQAGTSIATLANNVDRNNNHTFTLTATFKGNPQFEIQYYLVNRDNNGNYVANASPESTTYTGYITADQAVDATALVEAGGTTAKDYWLEFSKVGYEADKGNALNKLSYQASEVTQTSGKKVFKFYFKEKEYTISYVDSDGNPFNPAVANKTVGWNSSSLAPVTAPTRPGYSSVTWNYNGTPVAGKKVSDLLTAANESATGLTLTAVWGESKVTIIYSVQGDAGAAKVDPTSEQVDAATGTAGGSTVTLLKPQTYKLDGWFYSDGTGEHAVNPAWITTNANGTITIKPQKEGGVNVARTYYAKVSKLSDLSYTIEHYYMQTDGTYAATATETANGSDLENTVVNASSKRQNKQGFTYDPAAAGRIDSITLQTSDTVNRTLKLFYIRDSYNVEVLPVEAGKDSPLPMPAFNVGDLTTGKKYFGSTQNIPTVTVPDGWSLSWKLDGTALATTATTFTVPFDANGDGKVVLTAVWGRNTHTVDFSAADAPSGATGFAVTGPRANVEHGRTLTDASYNWSGVKVSSAPGYTLIGWTVYNDAGTKLDEIADNQVMTYAINQNTVFRARWAQTFDVTYYKGDHAAAGTVASKQYGPYTYIAGSEVNLPSWASETGNPSTDAPAAANGYKWIGWSWQTAGVTYTYYASDAPTGATNTPMPVHADNNYSFTAMWKALERTLSFSIAGSDNATWDNGTDKATPQTIVSETGATVAGSTFPKASRPGYKLRGWKVDGAADNTAITASTSYLVPEQTDATINFVPVWKLDGMTISYAVDGVGGTRSNDEDTVSADLAAVTTGSIAKADAGYNFLGWFLKNADGTWTAVPDAWVTNASGGKKIVPQADGGSASNYVWTEKTYYARFEAGNASLSIWFYQPDADGTYPSNTTQQDPGVSQTKDGRNVTTGQTYSINDFDLNMSRFKGFTLAADNNNVPTTVTVLGNGTSVLKVYLERVKNDVTFTFAPGDVPAGVTLPPTLKDKFYGSSVTVNPLSATGYNFAWSATYVDADGNTQNLIINNDRFTMPEGPVTVVGHWTNPTYHIVFTSDAPGAANMPSATNTVDFDRYNSDLSSTLNIVSWNGAGWVPMGFDGNVVEPTLSGFGFQGWFYQNASGDWVELTNLTTFADLAAHGMTGNAAYIYARWTTSSYNVFFESEGTRVATLTSGWFDRVSTTGVERPKKSGWSFSHWYYLDGTNKVTYAGGTSYETLAGIQGLTTTDIASTGAGITLYAEFTQNQTFSIEVYRGEYVGGQLVATTVDVPFTDDNWQPSWQLADGSKVVITPNANRKLQVTLTGDKADGVTIPTELTMPYLPGFVFDPAICNALGIYSTDQGNVLKIYYAPRSDYSVKYVLVVEGGNQQTVGTKGNITWTTADLGSLSGTVNTPAGYKLSGGWYYKNEAGSVSYLNAGQTYGQVADAIKGTPNNINYKEITLYINAAPQTYSVTFADDTNGTVDPYITIVTKDGYGWNSNVKAEDPAGMGYNKAGYKWDGWQVRPATGAPKNYKDGDTVKYSTLAGLCGLTDADIDTPVVLYAVWLKWQPVTIEFYTNDGTTETKLDGVVNLSAADKVVLTGGKYTVTKDIVDAHRPVGFTLAGALPSLTAVDGDNILKVVYTVNKGFKLILNKNKGDNSNVQTITGLTWTEQPYDKATAEPTQMGWTLLDKGLRWNTKADGTGHTFGPEDTYAQLAEFIFGDALNEELISQNGLTLYAQWQVANNFQVHYDFNNDKDSNTNVKTDYDENFDPSVADELKETPVSWIANGFDKDSDYLVTGAPFGYEFDHWNTKPDGTGIRVDSANTYEDLSKAVNPNFAAEMVKLYAQWREIMVEIKYVVDNESAGTIDRFVDKLSAVTKTAQANGSSPGTQLTSVAKAKPGWHFVEWRLVDNGTLHTAAVRSYAGTNTMDTSSAADGSLLKLLPASEGRLYGATYQAVFARNDDAKIEYDRNDDLENDLIGTGEVAPTTDAHGSYVTLSNGKGFKRDHYTLVSWNTKADGTGTRYKLGQTNVVLPEAGMKLYAQWELDSHSITVNDPKNGGTIEGPRNTSLKYGEKIPQSFVDGLKPQPRPGWTHTGWEYVIKDPITGEKTTGFTTDPTELTVDGDIELTPVYEGADIVDGPPRTGDDADYNYELMLAALWTALAAALAAMMLMIIARRRRNEEVYAEAAAEAKQVYGMHSITWSNAKAVSELPHSSYGAHSIRRQGERMGEKASASKRLQRVLMGVEAGYGKHSVATSRDGRTMEISHGCNYGEHSIRRADDGKHSVCVVPGDVSEAREAAAEVVTCGKHTIFETGESVTAAYGAHTVVSAQTLEVAKAAPEIVPPKPVKGAHSASKGFVEGAHSVRKGLENAAGAAHSASTAAVQGSRSAGRLSQPALNVAGAVGAVGSMSPYAAALGRHAVRESIKTAAQRVNMYGTHSIKDFEIGIFEDILAPAPPKKPNEIRVSLGWRWRTMPKQPISISPEDFLSGESLPSGVAACAKQRISTRIAVGVPTAALAICLSVFGVGPTNAPVLAFADEGGGSASSYASQSSQKSGMSPGKAAFAGRTVSSNSSSAPPQQSNQSSNAQAAATNPSGSGGSSSGSAYSSHANTSTDVHTSSGGSAGTQGTSAGSNNAQNGLYTAQSGSNDGSGTDSKGTTMSSDGKNDALEPENGASSTGELSSDNDMSVSEDRDNPSDSDSNDTNNNSGDDSDSTENDLLLIPLPSNPDGNDPVDEPADAGSITYAFSRDDSSNASYLTTYDSNAPPLSAQDDSPPPLDSGTYFIQWSQNTKIWLGEIDSELGVYQAPGLSLPILWDLSRVNGYANDDTFLVKIGQYYLAREAYGDFYDQYKLILTTDETMDEEFMYWTIAPKTYSVYSGYSICAYGTNWYIGAMYEDEEATYPIIRFKATNNPMEYYIWYLDQPQECDWHIDYFPNGATSDDSTPRTTVTVAEGGTVSECNYKRFGYTFVEWNTSVDGTGETYVPGEHLYGNGVIDSNYVLNLYAIWVENVAEIIYDTNISEGGSVSLGDTGELESTITQAVSTSRGTIQGTVDEEIKGVTAVAGNGYHFGSWQITGGIGEIPEDLSSKPTLTAEEVTELAKFEDPEMGWIIFHNTTLTANFIANMYKINFNVNGGTGSIAPCDVNYDDANLIAKANTPTRYRYIFKGWNTKADGTGMMVDDAATIEDLFAEGSLGEANGSATTLYAQWEKQPDDVDDPSSNPSNGGSNVPTNTNGNANGGNGSSANANKAGGSAGYRGYAADGSDMVPAVASTDELLNVTPVSNEKITTQGTKNEFFSTTTGIIIAAIGGIAAAAAIIAGIVALASRTGAAGTGAAGAGAASEGGRVSRLRRKKDRK